MKHTRPSIQTYSGIEFFPLEPRAADVDIFDIAHALSLKCRYTGHCLRFYSVAEHSVLMADHAEDRLGKEAALWALMHDAAEAYLPDVAGPIKGSLVGFAEIEETVWRAIALSFDIPLTAPYVPWVHELDRWMLHVEQRQIMRAVGWWQTQAPPEDLSAIECAGWDPARAKQEFLLRFFQFASQAQRRGLR